MVVIIGEEVAQKFEKNCVCAYEHLRDKIIIMKLIQVKYTKGVDV